MIKRLKRQNKKRNRWAKVTRPRFEKRGRTSIAINETVLKAIPKRG